MGGLPSASPVRNGNNFKLYANAPPSNCLFERMGVLEGGVLGAEIVMMRKRRHDNGKTTVHHITPHRRGQDSQLPWRFVSTVQGSWAALIKYQARIRASSSVSSDMSRLCLLSLLFVLTVSVIFQGDVAVERHISFLHYQPIFRR